MRQHGGGVSELLSRWDDSNASLKVITFNTRQSLITVALIHWPVQWYLNQHIAQSDQSSDTWTNTSLKVITFNTRQSFISLDSLTSPVISEQCKKKYILKTDRLTTSLLGKFQMAISPRGVVRSTSYLVLRWGFRGRRIEWRYFRFRQILKNSNGDMSAADHPIYSVFGSSIGFSGSVDRMALFPVWPNSIGMREKTMREE